MTDTAPLLANKSGDDSYRDISLRKISWAVLILLTLYVCYFSHLGAIGFIGPDEPRYAWIARDMAESGDWVTPRLYGKPWFEKPVLYYWSAALCFKLFGVNEASARLPSAPLRLADRALGGVAFAVYSGNDRLVTCGLDGHAVQRDVERCYGFRGCCAESGTWEVFRENSAGGVAR